MKTRITSSIFIGLLCLLTLGVGQAQAQDQFKAMFANLNGDASPRAQVDVSFDTSAVRAGTLIYFQFFDSNGIQVSEFILPTDANGFASTAYAAPPNNNLFALLPPTELRGHVNVLGPAGIVGAAVLRQTLKKSEKAIPLPAVRRQNGTPLAIGTLFPFTLGEPGHRRTLLILNVSGTDVGVDVFLGTKGPDGTSRYYLPRVKPNSTAIVEIDPADANSHALVTTTFDCMVQFVEFPAAKSTKEEYSETMLVPAG